MLRGVSAKTISYFECEFIFSSDSRQTSYIFKHLSLDVEPCFKPLLLERHAFDFTGLEGLKIIFPTFPACMGSVLDRNLYFLSLILMFVNAQDHPGSVGMDKRTSSSTSDIYDPHGFTNLCIKIADHFFLIPLIL